MTIVVGIRGGNGVLLGADSAGTSGGWGDQRPREDAKVFSLSELVAVGYCGSYRMGQLLRYNLTLPELAVGRDPFEWAVQQFIPAARTTLKTGGLARVDSGVERLPGGFLLAVRDRLLSVEVDLQVAEASFPWAAEGSGFQVAAGALAAELGFEGPPAADETLEQVARRALEVAAKLNAYCRPPFQFIRTKRVTDKEVDTARALLDREPAVEASPTQAGE